MSCAYPSRVPLAQIHLRNSGLPLPNRGQPQQKARQRRAGAVVRSDIRREAVRELVVAAILEEPPHRPDEPLVSAAELQAVAAELPAQRVASFDDRVPRVHRRCRIAVADR